MAEARPDAATDTSTAQNHVMTDLYACDKCMRPMGKNEVCWRKDIAANGLPIMVAMCEDCWEAFVWEPTAQQHGEQR